MTNTQTGPPIFNLHGTTTSNTQTGPPKLQKLFMEKEYEEHQDESESQKGVKRKSSTVNLKKTTKHKLIKSERLPKYKMTTNLPIW